MKKHKAAPEDLPYWATEQAYKNGSTATKQKILELLKERADASKGVQKVIIDEIINEIKEMPRC